MIKVDLSQFSQVIERFVEKTKGKEKQFALEFIQDMNESVIESTPVKTGFLKGSWWASINDAATGPGVADQSGATTVARVNLSAAEMQIGDVYYMLNGANYAQFVEYGTARMAPRAFVRGTIDQAQQFASEAADRVSKL